MLFTYNSGHVRVIPRIVGHRTHYFYECFPQWLSDLAIIVASMDLCSQLRAPMNRVSRSGRAVHRQTARLL
jgi:hypothetical protein